MAGPMMMASAVNSPLQRLDLITSTIAALRCTNPACRMRRFSKARVSCFLLYRERVTAGGNLKPFARLRALPTFTIESI